jgi:hypothetical protein
MLLRLVVIVDRHSTAGIWCRVFSVLFARAPTRSPQAPQTVL